MSQCMPTGMGLPLLMFLKQSLYHILYQVLREKCAIWNRSWPERQNTWFMSWPCFYTAEWSYAKKQLNPSRALFPTHKRHKNKNGKSRKNLWIKYLLRSISMYRMEMYLGFWDWILKLWRKYLCNFGRSATEQTGINSTQIGFKIWFRKWSPHIQRHTGPPHKKGWGVLQRLAGMNVKGLFIYRTFQTNSLLHLEQ